MEADPAAHSGPTRAGERPGDVLHELGARVLGERERLGWTRAHLAQRAGISLRFLADVEHGNGNLSVQRLAEICQALGVPVASMFAVEGAGGPGRAAARVDQKLALVGLRGAGKSTLGAALAERLGWAFVEVDARVEQVAGMRLGDLFEYLGAARYRQIEHQVLAELLDAPGHAVLATGGSVVTAPETWELLRARAWTVWLRATPEAHLARVEAQGDFRPMRGRANALMELKEILGARTPLYAQAAWTLETEFKGVGEAVGELLGRVRSDVQPRSGRVNCPAHRSRP
ncbi:MAG: helix-turn-helix domain-containing protein [Myxococcales bacterium]|nr:helix-turn-helix domain-containing protein [Myxococcales bacterium]